MLFLIYGASGWIGNQFVNIINSQSIKFIIGRSRVDNIDHVELEITEVKPTHVISFIGRTHGAICGKEYTTIDYLEQPGKLVENIRDNLYSPVSLALLCKKYNIHMTYLGTGCIFNFDDEHPYGKEENGFTELNNPNFFGSSYSIVKGFTDMIMRQLQSDVLNLRIRMPITDFEHQRNFITKITKYEKICSIPNSMTVLPEMLPIMLDMIKNNVNGTFNLTNPGLISHNEILEMYKEVVDTNFTYKNFTLEEQSKILESERSNNFLDTSKISEMYPSIKNIKESVYECLMKYKHTIKKKNVTNILVTGGCGFIGSNFINHMLNKYDNIVIVNIDAMYYCANEFNIEERFRKCDKYKFVKGNVCSEDLVSHILGLYDIDKVVHFAAQSHVQNSFDDSKQFTKDNIEGTHNLLECCRLYGKIKLFIHVSTDEVYGESMLDVNEKQKIEHSVLCPTNPYAATKAGAELLAQSYSHSYGLPIIITRGNNVYGLNQYPEKLIPRFVKLLVEGKKVTIQGNGTSVRSFLHVTDTARAFDCILNNGKVGEIYNIGCDDGMEYSVMEVAKMLIKRIKYTENYSMWIDYISDRPYNDMRYYISNEKLKKIGWNIQIKFSDGIDEIINNYIQKGGMQE